MNAKFTDRFNNIVEFKNMNLDPKNTFSFDFCVNNRFKNRRYIFDAKNIYNSYKNNTIKSNDAIFAESRIYL